MILVSQGLLSQQSIFFIHGHFFFEIFNLLPVFWFIIIDHLIEFSLRSFLFTSIIGFDFLSLPFIGDSELNHAILVSIFSLFLFNLIFFFYVFNFLLKLDDFPPQQAFFFHVSWFFGSFSVFNLLWHHLDLFVWLLLILFAISLRLLEPFLCKFQAYIHLS